MGGEEICRLILLDGIIRVWQLDSSCRNVPVKGTRILECAGQAIISLSHSLRGNTYWFPFSGLHAGYPYFFVFSLSLDLLVRFLSLQLSFTLNKVLVEVPGPVFSDFTVSSDDIESNLLWGEYVNLVLTQRLESALLVIVPFTGHQGGCYFHSAVPDGDNWETGVLLTCTAFPAQITQPKNCARHTVLLLWEGNTYSPDTLPTSPYLILIVTLRESHYSALNMGKMECKRLK